jgi:4'-phosphopantetheinyl transferase
MIEAYMLEINRDMTGEEYRSILWRITPEKRERIEKFRYFADKQRVMTGDILARLALVDILRHKAEETGYSSAELPLHKLILEQGDYGKPIWTDYPDIHFNISHAGSHVACVVSDSPVGIDVEMTKQNGFREVAKRFFAPDEWNYVDSFQTEEEQQIAFTKIWTMKEAYIKRDGRGLSILTSFSALQAAHVFFHAIPTKADTIPTKLDAVCHVCSEEEQAPKISYFTIESLINALK